jgi:hypothetical protein
MLKHSGCSIQYNAIMSSSQATAVGLARNLCMCPSTVAVYATSLCSIELGMMPWTQDSTFRIHSGYIHDAL